MSELPGGTAPQAENSKSYTCDPDCLAPLVPKRTMPPKTRGTAAMQQIADWLEKLGLGQYANCFAENDINPGILSDLTDQDLKEIGVSSLGHRRQLLRAIAELKIVDKGTAKSTTAAAAPLAAPQTDAGERRYVTVMFCDLVGSTSISAGLDAEEWRDLVGAYFDAASSAVTEMGGHVAKKLGDGLMALFGYPVAQENDAERAARAALSIQRALGRSESQECRCWQTGAQRAHRHRNRPCSGRCGG